MSPGMPWPPKVGQLLPHREAAFGVRDKLAGYVLNQRNEIGGAKARGFERILGITVDDIDYLEATILDAVETAPIDSIRDNSPYGVNCVVDVQVRGLRDKSGRMLRVRTVWLLADASTPPRLVSAYPKS
jgi:hypothetical protein